MSTESKPVVADPGAKPEVVKKERKKREPKVVDPNAPPKEKVPRKSKQEAMTPEVFELAIDELIKAWQAVYTNYTGVHKKTLTFPDGAPGKNEFVGFEKRLQSLVPEYRKLSKKPKKKQAKNSGSTDGKGFKQYRYVCKSAVEFVNTYGNLPAELKLIPLKDLGGDAVWNIAQATQLIIGYVEVSNMKTESEKSKIVLNQPLVDLFKPFFKELDRKMVTERDGKYIINHTTLQSLIPKLFDKRIPVMATELTPADRKRMTDREVILHGRTVANKGVRDAATKVIKDKNKAETLAKRDIARAAKEAANKAAAEVKAQQAAAKAAAAAAKATLPK
jgi:hypothetical protein